MNGLKFNSAIDIKAKNVKLFQLLSFGIFVFDLLIVITNK